VLLALASIIQGCCEEEWRITSMVSMRAMEGTVEGDDVDWNEVSTIKGRFILNLLFQKEITMLNNFSVGTPCYAMSCSDVNLNKIDYSSFSISINNHFFLNGDSIPANKNLLTVLGAGVYWSKENSTPSGFLITDTFLTNAVAGNDSCTFTFNGKTDDNVILFAERTFAVDM